MHIPDGFLTANVYLPAWLVSAAFVWWFLKRLTKTLRERAVPLMGVLAAFIFAAQMLTFPVAAGTSGHLLGGALAAILLGPYAGSIIITLVLVVQALVFLDGGISTLGANILNMALLGTFITYFIYVGLRKMMGKNRVIPAAVISAWLSVVLASSLCGVELALSGVSPLRVVLPAMAGVHSLIGIGEAVITASVLKFLLKVKPELVYGKTQNE